MTSQAETELPIETESHVIRTFRQFLGARTMSEYSEVVVVTPAAAGSQVLLPSGRARPHRPRPAPAPPPYLRRPDPRWAGWLSVDDATVANGCVRYISGSHRFGLVDWEYLPYLLTEDVLARETPVPLRAGDAVFHHSLTLHCSGPNTTPHRRWGWAMHYVPAETRYIGKPEDDERLRQIDALDRPDPRNGFPLLQGREFPGCV